MSVPKVMDKIQKLLSLSESPNQAEAELAMSKAYELMTTHNISLQDVHDLANETIYVESDLAVNERQRPEDTSILHLLKTYFNAACWVSLRKGSRYYGHRSEATVKIAGRESDVQVARYVYVFLVNTYKELFLSELAKFPKGSMSRKEFITGKQHFYEGIADGISSTLDKMKTSIEQEYGLVIVKDPNLIEENYVKGIRVINKRYRSNPEAYARGKELGSKVSINKPIANQSNGLKLLN